MKVKCIYNIPGNGTLTINSLYTVYAISICNGNLYYLISSSKDFISPSWNLSEKFEIIDPLLPIAWYFNFYKYGDDNPLTAIWGYKEIVYNKKHNIDLLEYHHDALEIFAKRKEEIDEYEDLGIKKPISENSYY